MSTVINDRDKERTIEIMSAVLFKEDIKNEKEIVQSSDALRTRKGMRVGAMDPDATSGLGTSDFPGWLVFVAQGREPNLGYRRIHPMEDLLVWHGCHLPLPLLC